MHTIVSVGVAMLLEENEGERTRLKPSPGRLSLGSPTSTPFLLALLS